MQDGGTPTPVQQNTPAAGKRNNALIQKRLNGKKPNLPEILPAMPPPFQKPLPDSHFFKLENIKQINAFISPQKGL